MLLASKKITRPVIAEIACRIVAFTCDIFGRPEIECYQEQEEHEVRDEGVVEQIAEQIEEHTGEFEAHVK